MQSILCAVFLKESFNNPVGVILFANLLVKVSNLQCRWLATFVAISRCSSRIFFSVSSLKLEMLLILNQVKILPDTTTARINMIESLDIGINLLFIVFDSSNKVLIESHQLHLLKSEWTIFIKKHPAIAEYFFDFFAF